MKDLPRGTRIPRGKRTARVGTLKERKHMKSFITHQDRSGEFASMQVSKFHAKSNLILFCEGHINLPIQKYGGILNYNLTHLTY